MLTAWKRLSAPMMKSTKNLFLSVATLSLMIVGSNCSSSPIVSTPRPLEQRTLRISPDHPGLEYTWFECEKKFLWMCSKKVQRKEIYDLNDKAMREKLIAARFVARVLSE